MQTDRPVVVVVEDSLTVPDPAGPLVPRPHSTVLPALP